MTTNSQLKKLEQRVNEKIAVDPEEAIKMINKFIDLACSESPINNDEKVTLYEFVWWVNQFLLVEQSKDLPSKILHWQNIESYIKNNDGFRVDGRESAAEELRECKP